MSAVCVCLSAGRPRERAAVSYRTTQRTRCNHGRSAFYPFGLGNDESDCKELGVCRSVIINEELCVITGPMRTSCGHTHISHYMHAVVCTVRLSQHISRLWGRHGVRYDAVVDDEAADATKFSYSVRFRRKRTYPYMHGLRTYAYAVGVDFVCLIRYDIALHPARYGTTVPTFLPHMAWHGMYTPAYSCVHCSASIYMYPDTQQTEFPVQSSSPELPHPFWIGINVPIPTNKKHEKKALAGIERHTETHALFF
jgi:hypothetical protein